ncbi:MAG: type II toxin-antitoxin system HicB family antitoxin [Bryobacteraceae bacterium]
MSQYAVVFDRTSTGYGAHVPDLPGCISTGRTLEETRENMREAIEFHIEGLRLHGYPVPEATAHAEDIEVRVA